VDNDGVPSILGVDFLKHLGATLTYSNAGDACSWIDSKGKQRVIPMHCTSPEIKGTFSLNMAQGVLLQPYGERNAEGIAMAYVDIDPENVRFNQNLYCSPTTVTVETNNSERGEDHMDLQPTTGFRNCILTPQLKLVDGKLKVVVYIPLKNKTDNDLVLAPGITIGSVTVMSTKDTSICIIEKHEFCNEKLVKESLSDYVSASRSEAAREGVKKFNPKTSLPKTDWRKQVEP
jgi:hypothetical protein